MQEFRFMTLDEIVQINKSQIILFGGLIGIRDKALLESALHEPMKTFDQKYLYENIFIMAAVYAHSIIKNHPFVDGNKRTGILTALLFLHYNGFIPKFKQDELYEVTMNIAISEISILELAKILESKCNH